MHTLFSIVSKTTKKSSSLIGLSHFLLVYNFLTKSIISSLCLLILTLSVLVIFKQNCFGFDSGFLGNLVDFFLIFFGSITLLIKNIKIIDNFNI